MLTAGVAVDKATLDFDLLFSYKIPEEFLEKAQPGAIVLVPFGNGNKLRQGIILSTEEKENTENLKTIVDLKTDDSTITPYVFFLIEYLKENTFCTWYEAVKTVLPRGAMYKIKNGKLEKNLITYTETVYTSNEDFSGELLKTKKQKSVFEFCKRGAYTRRQITAQTGAGISVINTLIKKAALKCKSVDKDTYAYRNIKKCRDGVSLTEKQQKIYDDITQCTDKKPHLIYGVTSSGKTMIYIKLIENALKQRKSTILLVPEISLTPQMIKTVKEYFGEIVGVIHSNLSRTERLLQYKRAQKGKTKILIGARSAIFTPMENLGLIIVDEEHEKTFKSESAPRYSAIRLAEEIRRKLEAKLVLASATPSVESFYLAQRNYYHLHILNQRYKDLPLPGVEIVDLSRRLNAGDIGPISGISLGYIEKSISKGGQTIVLINRRGYSTIGICKDCKQTLQCDDCSVNLVRHKSRHRLVCHYCGRVYPEITKCPNCGGEIIYQGYGTQKIEEYIKEKLPPAKVLRIDGDTTAGRSHDDILNSFANKEYNVLVGTQIVAKGLDFGAVDLVVILGIDSLLNHRGYSTNEEAFNLVTQVIGRAGRRKEGAKALIETFDPFNPVIKLAAGQDYISFYKNEIAYRKLNNYPPYCTLVTVAFTHGKENVAAKDASNFLEIIKKTVENYDIPLMVLGPASFDVAKVNKVFRWRLTIKCVNNKKFRDFLRRAIDIYLKDKRNKSSVYVNINSALE